MDKELYTPVLGKELTINEKLDSLIKGMGKEKEKKFKMPLRVRLFKGKFRRENNIIVCFIRNNGAVVFKIMKIEDETILFNEKIYDASARNILRYKRKPIVIIKEWDMKPFSPEEEFDKAEKEGTLTAAQKLILTKMKLEAIKPKLQLNWKIVLVILAIGAGLLYLLDYLKII